MGVFSMQNIKKQTAISSLDFNNLRKLMDALINLKKIDVTPAVNPVDLNLGDFSYAA